MHDCNVHVGRYFDIATVNPGYPKGFMKQTVSSRKRYVVVGKCSLYRDESLFISGRLLLIYYRLR